MMYQQPIDYSSTVHFHHLSLLRFSTPFFLISLKPAVNSRREKEHLQKHIIVTVFDSQTPKPRSSLGRFIQSTATLHLPRGAETQSRQQSLTLSGLALLLKTPQKEGVKLLSLLTAPSYLQPNS